MFTGIVEELGRVGSRDGSRVRIEARQVLEDVTLGASISVNGCCLTVVAWEDGDGGSGGNAAAAPRGSDPGGPGGSDGPGGPALSWWEADVSDETFARTSLGSLQPGDPVNLERPVRLQDRLGGHLVQGHVDAVGEIVESAPALRVRMPVELRRYVVEKGSITVDGVSLTVVDPRDDTFSVAVIPHTAEVTTLGHKGPGDLVNLEVDVMAKYAEQLLRGYLPPPANPQREAR